MDKTEAKRLYDLEYSKRNKEKISIRMKQYYIDNKVRIDARNKEWASDNPRTEYIKGYVKANLPAYAERSAKRRARQLNATPTWANHDKIKEIYKNCPKGYHVDHILPLQGKTVCGLHVENNLQYLSASENCSKGNRLG